LQSASAQLESLLDSVAELEAARAEARELMEQTRRLYLAGEANLTELLDAFRAAEEARLGVIELDGEIVQVRLERMRAAGTLLDASLDEACVGGEERAR
jgi:outer membrane protein TolC